MTDTHPAPPIPTPPKAVLKMAEPDYIGPKKNLYSVGYYELVWRNFLAGISRGIGSVLVQLVFFFFVMGVLAKVIAPMFGGLFEGVANTLQSGTQGGNQMIPSYEQLFGIIPQQPD